MLKLWLVKFSNGEEWHVFGEADVVWDHCYKYILDMNVDGFSMSFLRAYRSK